MTLPFFYTARPPVNDALVLDEDTSKHIVQVLRMTTGELLHLTDGKGSLFTAEITDGNRKRCAVKIIDTVIQPPAAKQVSVAISLLKNSNRFEWFIEKATEIGVTGIIPLVSLRTEKTAFKPERLQSVIISAMLQSQQTFLPLLQEPVKFNTLIAACSGNSTKYIAHCEDENSKQQLSHQTGNDNTIILIGPEGDFTREEINVALQHDFIPVSLGNTRLRTETAGIVAATLLCNI